MTARRLSLDPPLASTGWAARKAPMSLAYANAYAKAATYSRRATSEAREAEEIWHDNMARRDAAAAAYGDPETPHEFYAGRPGSQAETIVCNCLRALRALRAPDDLYAHALTVSISDGYLATAPDSKTEVRRASALVRIARERA
jgi:hypothetical protein